ncbi:hypothetical protein ACIA49_35265 [Kribbella sp. NPDC051587]|uniref:hypothetical protein n=1 Tax=Kribbella sp. NPDC051587 TaxID=3364119 RepID=UPI00379BD927
MIGGTDLQLAIAAGAGSSDATNPWNVAVGNAGGRLTADFRTGATAEVKDEASDGLNERAWRSLRPQSQTQADRGTSGLGMSPELTDALRARFSVA